MSQDPKLTSKIAVLGAGDVGSTIAYSLIMNPIAGDILIVDPKEEVRDAQVQDLSDATFHGGTTTRVRAGTHKEAGQCDIVVITAGAKQKKGVFEIQMIVKTIVLKTNSYEVRAEPILLAAIKPFLSLQSAT